MGFKIAIATTDGKIVNEHFGKAEKFAIVEANMDGSFAFVETRDTRATCTGGAHDDGGLERTAELLSDCEYVLVSRIGPGAEDRLARQGVTAFAISLPINEAVAKLAEYLKMKKGGMIKIVNRE